MNFIPRYVGIFLVAVFVSYGSMFMLPDSAVAQVCSVGVIKNANPADNTPFDFTSVTTGQTLDFTLRDPDSPNRSVSLSAGISTITEEVPSGWALASIDCVARQGDEGLISFSVNGPTVTINCINQGTLGAGTCTFNNVIAQRNVPTLSEWGLIAMAALLGLAAFYVIRRRQAPI